MSLMKKSTFNTLFNKVVTYVNEEQVRTRLSIPQKIANELLLKLKIWNKIYLEYIKSSIPNHSLIIEINELQKEYEQNVSELQESIKYGIGVVLTAIDRDNLEIPEKKTREKVGEPTELADVQFAKIGLLSLTIELSKRNLPEINDRTPFDRREYDAANIYTIITEVTITEAPEFSKFRFLKKTSKAINQLSFNAEEGGNRFWVIARFVNTEGEEGPKNFAASMIIPGE